MTKSEIQLNDCYYLGEAIIEPARNRITCNGENYRVTRLEMDVLMCLVQNGTQVVSREEVMDRVWKNAPVNEEVLTLAISRLRRVLSDSSKTPQFIETIPKRGYRVMIPVHPCVGGQVIRPIIRSPKFWFVVLTIMLLMITSLYIIVRMEYQKVSRPQDNATQSVGDPG